MYLTNNFVITNSDQLTDHSKVDYLQLVEITPANCGLVASFRTDDRVAEYQAKLANGEVGYFANASGNTVGSIWATINRGQKQFTARRYMPLQPNEAMIHDIVTGDRHRGRGVGAYMVSAFSSILLQQHKVARIVVDVSVRNHASLRMMEKAGFRPKEEVLYISAFGGLLAHKVLKRI